MSDRVAIGLVLSGIAIFTGYLWLLARVLGDTDEEIDDFDSQTNKRKNV